MPHRGLQGELGRSWWSRGNGLGRFEGARGGWSQQSEDGGAKSQAGQDGTAGVCDESGHAIRYRVQAAIV